MREGLVFDTLECVRAVFVRDRERERDASVRERDVREGLVFDTL